MYIYIYIYCLMVFVYLHIVILNRSQTRRSTSEESGFRRVWLKHIRNFEGCGSQVRREPLEDLDSEILSLRILTLSRVAGVF